MAYKISTEFKGGSQDKPNQEPKNPTTVTLTVEKENLSFPRMVFQVLNFVKTLAFSFGMLLAILNRHRLLDTYGQYEKHVLSTMGTILKKNFHQGGFSRSHPEHHYVEMHGLLSYDNMLFMFVLALTAVIC